MKDDVYTISMRTRMLLVLTSDSSGACVTVRAIPSGSSYVDPDNR
jgi:hypothetical protein